MYAATAKLTSTIAAHMPISEKSNNPPMLLYFDFVDFDHLCTITKVTSACEHFRRKELHDDIPIGIETRTLIGLHAKRQQIQHTVTSCAQGLMFR